MHWLTGEIEMHGYTHTPLARFAQQFDIDRDVPSEDSTFTVAHQRSAVSTQRRNTMNRNLTPERPRGAAIAIAAALSTLIAVGIMAGVTDLFQSRGAPMAQLADAERACALQIYVSDRERCMREWIAASSHYTVADR